MANKNDSHVVRCLECGSILRCSSYNTAVLLDHIKKRHPNIKLEKKVRKNQDSETETSNELCKSSETSLKTQEDTEKYKRFRKSLENWCPYDGEIYCPVCDENKKTCVRSRNEFVFNSMCETVGLLCCWPICLLPFMESRNGKYLHCATCEVFFGLYDPIHYCIHPNIQIMRYVEGNQNCNKFSY